MERTKLAETIFFHSLSPVNENSQFQRGKVDIFYKEQNPNGTRFTEVAFQETLRNIGGIPVVGYWNSYLGDFEGHNKEKGKPPTVPLGFVSETPNTSFTEKTHADGSKHLYATVDVLIWAKRYEYAKEVITGQKGQSMEIDPEDYEGEFVKVGGKDVFEFSKASISALCILGDSYKPAFEASKFYSLGEESFKDFQLQFSLMKEAYKNEGGTKMLNFRLSHDDIRTKLYRAINPMDDEGYMVYDFSVARIYDEYAVIYHYDTETMYRQYYAKQDNTNTISLGERVQVDMVDLTKTEQEKLDFEKSETEKTLAEVNSKIEDYEKQIEELNGKMEESSKSITEFEQKVKELDEAIVKEKTDYENNQSEIQKELEELKVDFTAKEQEITELAEQVTEYEKLKVEILNAQKEEVLRNYETMVSAELIEEIRTDFEKMSVEDIENKLAISYAKEQMAKSKINTDNSLIAGITNYTKSSKRQLTPAEELLLNGK